FEGHIAADDIDNIAGGPNLFECGGRDDATHASGNLLSVSENHVYILLLLFSTRHDVFRLTGGSRINQDCLEIGFDQTARQRVKKNGRLDGAISGETDIGEILTLHFLR